MSPTLSHFKQHRHHFVAQESSVPSQRIGKHAAEDGHSVFELMVVFIMIAVLTAFAIPQMIGQRRLLRSTGAMREVITQLRYTRQMAMSQRQAFTLQYNDTTKSLVIIDHNTSGPALLADPAYPNNTGSTTISTIPLTQGGLPTAEIKYGIPAGLPTGALPDGITKTALASSKVNVTFQPDGTIIDSSGNPVSRALFFYNNKATAQTAAAISIMGASGRVKLWRYDAGVNKYAE